MEIGVLFIALNCNILKVLGFSPTENAFASNIIASDRELVSRVCEWISECASGTSHR